MISLGDCFKSVTPRSDCPRLGKPLGRFLYVKIFTGLENEFRQRDRPPLVFIATGINRQAGCVIERHGLAARPGLSPHLGNLSSYTSTVRKP
jgi:hypothetical protein